MSTYTNTKFNAAQILTAAVVVAERDGFGVMSRASIAEQVGCKPGLVSYYFSTMTILRRDVMRHAVKHGVLKVVAEGLATKNKYARNAPDDLKQKALATLAA